MVEVDRTFRTVVDCRRLNHSESLVCLSCDSGNRWAQFVVSWRDPLDPPRSPPRFVYLCRRHLGAFLTLADGIGVGQMPPVVRLALWYRLLGSEWTCPLCGVREVGGYGSRHCVRYHPPGSFAHWSWVEWFDREVASLWA